jgi:predicted transcriptional regulator
MAAVFGTASRAPFTSIVFALEVTQSYQGVLPVIITVVVAELVGEYLMTDSIMTEKLARRGMRVRHIYEFNPLRQIRISKLMSPLVAVDSKEKVIDVFREMNTPNHAFAGRKRLIVLRNGFPIGVVDRAYLFQGASTADPKLTVGRVCSKSFLKIQENEFGFEALRLMALRDAAFLVVIDSRKRAVGYVSRGDLIKAQKDKIADDTIVEKGIWARLFK